MVKRKHLIAGNVKFLKNIIRLYILFVLIFAAMSYGFITKNILASGSSYYVNGTSGSDVTGTGSLSNPYKTIQKACNVAANGDTVYIMAGIYTPPTKQISISNKNQANGWLTIRNYNNDYVVINGSDCPTDNYINATIEIKNSKYVRITGLTINHSAKGGITIMKTPCSFITIDNCTISNSSSFAFKAVNGLNNITFEHNYVYNNFNNWSHTLMSQETLSFENTNTFSISHNTIINNRGETIDMKGGCRHGVVCYNEINDSGQYLFKGGENYWGGVGIYIDARGLSYDISIYNNNIYGNNTGISLNTETTGHYEYIYIYNNIINISVLGGGIPLSGRNPISLGKTGSSTDVFHHVYIYSNTLITGVNNAYSVLKVGHYTLNQLNSDNLHDVYVVNNIFYSSQTSGGYSLIEINKISYEDNVFILNNNSFYRPTGAITIYWKGTSYTSTAHPEKFGNEPVFTNPLFTDYSHGDFHLQSTSPCKDAGNNALMPDFDFDGVNRPQGSAVDIGAFESFSEGDIIPPQISAMSIVTSNPLDTNPTYGWVNISGTVTDNVAVSQVKLRIKNPNNSWNNVSMIARTTGKYYYRTTTAFSTVGNYTYSIWAKDTSNNVASSNNALFSMPSNWDININYKAGLLDIVMVSNQYGSTGNPGWIREDVDNNGVINVLDINLVSNHYGGN